MISKLFIGMVVGLILLTSCGRAPSDVDEVYNASKYIDDLIVQLHNLDEDAIAALRAGDFENEGLYRQTATEKAREIERIMAGLQQKRPKNVQLPEDTVKLLAVLDEANQYAQLVKEKDQVFITTLDRMESLSGKSLSSLDEWMMKVYMRELLCMNLYTLRLNSNWQAERITKLSSRKKR